jgi:uncharacterized phage protein gp47/JayE
MAGVTPDGRVEIKRLAELIEETDAELRAGLGAQIRLGADSLLGLMRGALLIPVSQVWEFTGQLATAFDPRQARGELLDALVALSGVSPRLAGRPSQGQVTFTVVGGTTVPAGTRVRGSVSRVVVETAQAVTAGPSQTSLIVPVAALEDGPQVVTAGDLTEILTPRAGVSAVTNVAGLVPGRLRETDEELRIRRSLSLAVTGGGTEGAMRAELLALDAVDQAVILSNRGLTTLPSGQPGKSARPVLWPVTALPDDLDAIARALAGERGIRAGLQVWGTSESATVTLSSGQSLVVEWDWADAVPVYIDVTLTLAPLAEPGLALAVEAAIIDYLNAIRIGEDVRFLRLAQIVQSVSPSILSAVIELDTSPGPSSSADIPIAEDEIATIGAVTVT